MKNLKSAIAVCALGVLAASSASAATLTGTITRVYVTPGVTIIDLLSGGNTYTYGIDASILDPDMVAPMASLAVQAWADGSSVDLTNDTGVCLGFCVTFLETN
jgi:hypothetical protein